jgi:hypothetical protein
MSKRDVRMVTDGARDLLAYIRKHHPRGEGGVPGFCEKHGLNRIQVQRAINGDRQRFSVDFAHAIEKATRGAVRWNRWLSKTAKVESCKAA